MPFRPLPPGCRFWQPSTLLATVGGIGLIRIASGTWGSLAALPLAWLLWLLGGPVLVAAAGIGIGLVGVWAAGRVCRGGEPDSSAIVIDEVAGQLLRARTGGGPAPGPTPSPSHCSGCSTSPSPGRSPGSTAKSRAAGA